MSAKSVLTEQPLGRVARRRQRNHAALIAAGRSVMARKGIDAATMHEIAEIADVGAGTVYSFFKSKDELAIAVLEELMHDLALRIRSATQDFDDPAQVYAFGLGTTIDTATKDPRWRQLLYRSEVIANAMFRRMGPFAIVDLKTATAAGRFKVDDPALTFRMATHALVGTALAITNDDLPETAAPECLVRLLCMTGIGRDEAAELAARERPKLPPAPETSD